MLTSYRFEPAKSQACTEIQTSRGWTSDSPPYVSVALKSTGLHERAQEEGILLEMLQHPQRAQWLVESPDHRKILGAIIRHPQGAALLQKVGSNICIKIDQEAVSLFNILFDQHDPEKSQAILGQYIEIIKNDRHKRIVSTFCRFLAEDLEDRSWFENEKNIDLLLKNIPHLLDAQKTCSVLFKCYDKKKLLEKPEHFQKILEHPSLIRIGEMLQALSSIPDREPWPVEEEDLTKILEHPDLDMLTHNVLYRILSFDGPQAFLKKKENLLWLLNCQDLHGFFQDLIEPKSLSSAPSLSPSPSSSSSYTKKAIQICPQRPSSGYLEKIGRALMVMVGSAWLSRRDTGMYYTAAAFSPPLMLPAPAEKTLLDRVMEQVSTMGLTAINSVMMEAELSTSLCFAHETQPWILGVLATGLAIATLGVFLKKRRWGPGPQNTDLITTSLVPIKTPPAVCHSPESLRDHKADKAWMPESASIKEERSVQEVATQTSQRVPHLSLVKGSCPSSQKRARGLFRPGASLSLVLSALGLGLLACSFWGILLISLLILSPNLGIGVAFVGHKIDRHMRPDKPCPAPSPVQTSSAGRVQKAEQNQGFDFKSKFDILSPAQVEFVRAHP